MTRGQDGGARGRSSFPEVVPPLAKGVPEFQQAGADTALIVPTERFQPDRLQRVVGEDPLVVEGCDEVIPRRAGVLKKVCRTSPCHSASSTVYT